MLLNNNTIHDRLNMIMKHYSLNKRTFSLKIGVNEAMMSNYIGGRLSKPGADILEKILLSFDNINARWLLTGIGDMLKAEKNNCPGCAEKQKHIGQLFKILDEKEGKIKEYKKKYEGGQGEKEEEKGGKQTCG